MTAPAIAVPVTLSGAPTYAVPITVSVPAILVPVTLPAPTAVYPGSTPIVVAVPAIAVPVTLSGTPRLTWSFAVPAITAHVSLAAWPAWAAGGGGQWWKPAVVGVHDWIITLNGRDLATRTLVGFTLDMSISATPTASLTFVEEADVTDPETSAYDELVIATSRRTYFRGQVLSWDKTIAHGVTTRTVRAEGWQRLLGLSPVFPGGGDYTYTYNWPDNWQPSWGAGGGFITVVNEGPHFGTREHPEVDGGDILDTVIAAWTGPAITRDPNAHVVPGRYLQPNGASMSSVLDTEIGRGGVELYYWLDADMRLHVEELPAALVTGSEIPSRLISPVRLFTGGIEPMTFTEKYDSTNMRSAVWVAGPNSGAEKVTTGALYAGEEQISAQDYPELEAVGAAWMRGHTGAAWSASATLAAGGPVPEAGTYVYLGDRAQYALVAAVRGSCVVPGEGDGGMEWTLDLGVVRRSFVYEEAAVVTPAIDWGPTMPAGGQIVSIVSIVCDPVSDMKVGDVQVIRGWGQRPDGTSARLSTGTVRWSILLEGPRESSFRDIGGGAPAGGWWLSAASMPIMWTDAMPLGFTWCILNRGAKSLDGDHVIVAATFVPVTP